MTPQEILEQFGPRESMEYDVVVVGAGPAGLATAIRIKQLAAEQGKEVSVCVLEKGSEPGAHILSGAVMAELPQHIPIVLYCKTGIRSAEVLSALVGAGFSDAAHLHGGIVEWAKQIDPGLPMY